VNLYEVLGEVAERNGSEARGSRGGMPSATAASPAAIPTLVAVPIPRRDGDAFDAQGGVGDGRGEGQRSLRVGFGGAQVRILAGFRGGVLGAQELRAKPAENVIHDRFGVGDLWIARPAARLETDVREFVHQEL
jgi:hypothetical protein